jgi:hypothetical protein
LKGKDFEKAYIDAMVEVDKIGGVTTAAHHKAT